MPTPWPGARMRRPRGVGNHLARLWQDLLHVDRVGREDNFFELGGHSLLAVKLIERMRQVDLSADVRVLFGQPTLAALAAAVGGQQSVQVPANPIQADTQAITPDMLPLVELDQAAIDHILRPCPVALPTCRTFMAWRRCRPAFYHHLATTEGDPTCCRCSCAFTTRAPSTASSTRCTR